MVAVAVEDWLALERKEKHEFTEFRFREEEKGDQKRKDGN